MRGLIQLKRLKNNLPQIYMKLDKTYHRQSFTTKIIGMLHKGNIFQLTSELNTERIDN